jgi:hypothetical protein
MRHYILILLTLTHLFSFGQIKPNNKTDFNTIFICVDSITYKNLFQSKFLKDTLFFCKETHQETNDNSYTGKYFIGESSTIEFFQPKKSDKLGDKFGDWGIEFKTRRIGILENIIKKSNLLKYDIDTSTTTFFDSLTIPWYKTLSLKNSKNELSILEYQNEYLKYLGFTSDQTNKSMTYKEYNSILSNGRKYPRQFSMVTYIKLYADKKLIDDLQKFARINNCKKIKNKISNSETTIEFIEVDKLPKFQIQEITISLITEQNNRIVKINDNLYIKIKGKKATFIFKDNY